MREREKQVLLETLDSLWREHLVTLEHLRQVIGFRAYGQRDPLNEYKTEAFVLFESMLARLRETVTGTLMHDRLAAEEEEEILREPELPEMEAHHIDPTTGLDEFALGRCGDRRRRQGPAARAGEARAAADAQGRGRRRSQGSRNMGHRRRNAPCPCGSGKKYKQCHGKND